jgi:hypothetical protein
MHFHFQLEGICIYVLLLPFNLIPLSSSQVRPSSHYSYGYVDRELSSGVTQSEIG